MNLRVLVWAIALVVGSMLSACHFRHASLGTLTYAGKVMPSSGGVKILRGGATVPAADGIELQAGDVVETDAQSTAVIEFADGSATLMPGTKVTVGSIWTWFGKVFCSGPVNNDTDYANMSVEGTEYLAEVTNDRLVVTVLDGHVRVSSKKGAFAPVAVGAHEQLEVTSLSAPGAAPPVKRTISRDELNTLVEQLNTAQQARDGLVPDVTGLSQEAAKRKLEALGLDLKVEKHPAKEDQIGRVFSQSPAPGTRSPSVTVAVGARGVNVPDLRGLTFEQAQKQLPSGLSFGRRDFETTGKQPLDHITRQNPAPGKTVVEGSSVDVVIEALIMPNVKGKTLQQAQGALSHLELQVHTREQPDAKHVGIVLSQNPAAGTRIDPNAVVELVVGTATGTAHPIPVAPVLVPTPTNPTPTSPTPTNPTPTEPAPTGGDPRLMLSPPYIAFETVPLGSSRELILTLQNQGDGPLTVTRVAFGSSTKDFQVAATTTACTQVAPGASCSVLLTYRPSSAGTHSTTLRVQSNDPESPTSIEVVGSATNTTSPSQ